jgi:hydrogenase large subunit
LLGCWGAFQNPDAVDYTYRSMLEWGRKQFVTPGIIVDGELVTTSLLDINLSMRILLGNLYYEDWVGAERNDMAKLKLAGHR